MRTTRHGLSMRLALGVSPFLACTGTPTARVTCDANRDLTPFKRDPTTRT